MRQSFPLYAGRKSRRLFSALILTASVAGLGACATPGGSESTAGASNSEQEVLAEWEQYKAAWNNHDPAGIAGAFAQDGVYNNPAAGQPLQGRGIAQFTGGLFTAIPDFKVQIVSNELVEDRMAEQWVITGTWTERFPGGPLAGAPPSGKSFTVPGAAFYQWEDGKIKTYDAYFDQIAIVALGGRDVSQCTLTDALWPGEEGDAAGDAFATALYRLRKLLGDDIVLLHEGRVTLNAHRCWVDTWAFERLLTQADAAVRNGDTAYLNQSDKALALYRGAFLAAEADEPWTLSARERLRAKFIRQVAAVGQHMADMQAWDRAAEYYSRGLDVDNLAEELYQGLMRCYAHLDRHAEGLAVYRRLRQTLSVILGIKPSPSSEALYDKLRAQLFSISSAFHSPPADERDS